MATSPVSQTMGVITWETGFFAQITNIKHSGVKREAFDVTHMGVAAAGAGTYGNMLFLASKFIDGGMFEVEGHFNIDTLPPIGTAASSCTVKMGDSTTQGSLAASAFLTDWDVTGPLNGKMTFTAKLKISGAVTKTAGT